MVEASAGEVLGEVAKDEGGPVGASTASPGRRHRAPHGGLRRGHPADLGEAGCVENVSRRIGMSGLGAMTPVVP